MHLRGPCCSVPGLEEQANGTTAAPDRGLPSENRVASKFEVPVPLSLGRIWTVGRESLASGVKKFGAGDPGRESDCTTRRGLPGLCLIVAA
jgi:hypothetical protein